MIDDGCDPDFEDLTMKSLAGSLPRITDHARRRMQSRRINDEAVRATVRYGRTLFARKAVFKVIGRREIRRYKDEVDLEAMHGIHVVLSHDGAVITVYRNRGFRVKEFRKRSHPPLWL
jgi:hypothetical protein